MDLVVILGWVHYLYEGNRQPVFSMLLREYSSYYTIRSISLNMGLELFTIVL